MNFKIQKRKKGFLAICLTLILVLTQTVPVRVVATDYTVAYDGSDHYLQDGSGNSLTDGSLLKEGDIIRYMVNVGYVMNVQITYYDSDEPAVLDSTSESITQTEAEERTHTVKGYGSFNGAQLSAEAFKGWRLKELYGSGGYPSEIALQAVAYTESNITYVLNGGENSAENPAVYYEGKKAISLAPAVKTGYVFEGWYLDSSFQTKVTSISTAQTGNLTLYARFKKELQKGRGSITVKDVYYGETINPVVESDTNGTDNITIEYKEKLEADSTYSTTVPSRAGTYTARATFAKTDIYEEVVATDDFSIKKRKGEGSISVADVGYGKEPDPVVQSSTNGIHSVTILYKSKDASDDSYTETKPRAIGVYTAKAIFAETDGYQVVNATTDFKIGYIAAPEKPYQISGTVGENQYYTSVVHIQPASGYLIATSQGGSYQNQLDVVDSTGGFLIYLKKIDTGEMTDAIEVPAIKIDKEAPVILGIESGSTIYGDEVEVIVTDAHLNEVIVDGKAVSVANGKAVLKLSSDNGEVTYSIRCIDEAGNKKESRVVVAAEWMKSKTIPGGKVRLFSKYTYQLSNGTWKVNGDSTVYSGNCSICVDQDGDYSFSNAN